MKPKQRAALVRAVTYWGDAFPPPCECGCGDPVRFNERGPNKYVNSQHHQWNKDMRPLVEAAALADRNTIPIQNFREAINKIRELKGWSLAEIARRGGQQPGWLHTYMFDKRYNGIGREVATQFFRRVAGGAEVASRYQQRVVPKAVKQTDKAIAGIGMDQNKVRVDTGSWAVHSGNRKPR